MQRRHFMFLATAAAAGALSHVSLEARLAAAAPRTIRPEHPRLLLTDLDRIRNVAVGDPVAEAWCEEIIAVAEGLIGQPVSTYTLSGGRLLAVSREVLHRVYSLATAWILTDDPRYATRLWQELDAVCAFPDWHPSHFLDTAEMTHAVAIGYDWLYGHWTSAQRGVLETAIIDHGLSAALPAYAGSQPWPAWPNNWNIVCNGGMVAGALAVADVDTDLAEDILAKALASLPLALEAYGPDGGYPEGPAYWEYAFKYLVLLVASLESATGDDEGIADLPGVADTGDFPLHLTGPTGLIFNYYDGANTPVHAPELLWLAQRFGRDDVGWIGLRGIEERKSGWPKLASGLIWYDPELVQGPVEADTALDARFDRCCVVTFRSGWEREEALYLGAKGGDNSERTLEISGHSDMDIGTFVLDALGQRWFTELGSDDYGLPSYFRSLRWSYYRKRPEGQNTLVIGPGDIDSPGQALQAVGTVVARAVGPEEAWAVMDGTDARDGIVSWRRGWRLFDHRRRVLVQDEFELDEPQDVWWFAHTAAEVEIAADGRSATLTSRGESLLARITTPGAVFLELAARPLWTSPDPAGQSQNRSISKLAIRLIGVQQGSIAVEFEPRVPGAPAAASEPVAPLANWVAPASEVAMLTSLENDDTPIPAFAPGNFNYRVGELGTLTATAESGASATVTDGDASTPATVVVTKPGHRPGRYLIWQHNPWGLGNFARPIIASDDDGNVPENTMDGQTGTRWSAFGDGQWIAFDLGSDGPIGSIRIAWQSGEARVASFAIEVAGEDDLSWTPVWQGQSSGTTAGLETTTFGSVTARYVRIVCFGTSTGQWNSITEVEIPGREVETSWLEQVEHLELAVGDVPVDGSAASTLAGIARSGAQIDVDDWTVEYLSLDESVATVDQSGVISGESIGAATVVAIATSPGRRLLHTACSVAVGDPDRPRFASIGDTYVRAGRYADTNNGTFGVLRVKATLDPDDDLHRRAFLEFAPQPQSRPIAQVLLHLYARVADPAGSSIDLVVRAAAGAFDEATTTWNNQPTLGAALGAVPVDSSAAWRTVDLTNELADQIADGEAVLLALVQEPASGAGLATEVSGRRTMTIPYLEVVLA